MLEAPVAALRDLILDSARASKHVDIIAHADCDGIAAGAVMYSAASRAGADVSVRAVRRLDPQSVRGPVAVMADVGAGMASELDSRLGESWAVLDHHEIPESEMDSPRVANPRREGLDGAHACACSIAHMAAEALDCGGTGWAAVVAALGDGHDSGEGRALGGADGAIAAEAAKSGSVRIEEGALLSGRTTRPLAEALAATTRPFMEGVTWNEPECARLLRGAGIGASEGGRMRVPADLSEQEQSALFDAVSKRSGVGPDSGAAYALPAEDPRGPLRDAREFAALLSACGTRAPGAAFSLCMGQRGRVLAEASSELERHRGQVREHIAALRGERWRIDGSGPCVTVNGDGVVPEEMTGAVSSVMAGSARSSGKIVLLHTQHGEEVKFSSRKSPGCGPEPDLHELMREGARRCGGYGGGRRGSAAARISKDRLDDFLGYVKGNVEVQG